MLKHSLFKQAFAKVKDYLPDIEVQSKVEKILQECDIVTQTEMDKQLKQIESMRKQLKSLEQRLDELEKKKA